MNYISLIFLIIISVFTFSSCSTDIDVNGDYEDIPIVYCVLDQSQEFQYVKVNKTFLGSLPASEMAQVSDSLFYNDVKVVLKEYLGSTFQRSWEFAAIDTIEKPDTIFVGQMDLNEEATYELEVDINNGEHIVTGETDLISGLYIMSPSSLAPEIEVAAYTSDFEYKYKNGSNGKVYQMTIVFNYLEVSGQDTTEHSIVWPQNKEMSTSTSSDPIPVVGKFSNLAFYNLLTANIPEAEEGITRLVKMPNSLEFNLGAADENYATYMEITSPSNGIVQEKPSFTNLVGGYGLLASRYNVSLKKKLGVRTLDSISRGVYAGNLGFVHRYDAYYESFD